MNSMRSELILTALAATLTVLTPATAPARTRYTAKALNYANKNGQFSPVAIGSGLDVMGTVFLKKERGYSAFIGNGETGSYYDYCASLVGIANTTALAGVSPDVGSRYRVGNCYACSSTSFYKRFADEYHVSGAISGEL